MLSPRDSAQGAYREVQSMGKASVMGGDMEVITAARLDRARRAERSIELAFASQRTGMLEPSDDVLTEMLRQVRTLRQTLEADSFSVRGGVSGDDWTP